MDQSPSLTPDEQRLIQDTHFYPAKAVITLKVKRMLEELHAALKEEIDGTSFVAPEGVDVTVGQFVKGEHLHDFPYQYLDFPKYFTNDEKFTFRSLFWWGHHFIFAWILEGLHLNRYKQNLLYAYDHLSDRNLFLSMAPTLWAWEKRPELILEIRKDTRRQVEMALPTRPFLKIQRFVDLNDPIFEKGELAQAGGETFRLLKPLVTK
ncbi:MAG: hypothetical protein HY282_09875 [Nitrospirae bacterium]|nr:hypothetical protein [Candidatus Manganitrophaceae bacterium]